MVTRMDVIKYKIKMDRINKGFFEKLVLIMLIVGVCSLGSAENSENKTESAEEISENIVKRLKFLDDVSGRSFSDVYQNGTFRTGSVLWDNILNQCSVQPSVKCLQKNVYTYLDDTVGFDGDVQLTSGVCFNKNNVDINKYSKEANIIYLKGSKDSEETERALDEDVENEIPDEDESETPLEEVTDALYDKSVKFLVTHDVKLTLPEIFFHGATLKISPRALTKTGALVHVELEPRVDDVGEGRIFFKKIKKYIKKKLLLAALAVILVIKLIALKLIFVLPLITGVTTAKKLLLKFLLFLFPALSHIFKLCSWYHQSYHTTKYHHHHHLITHHHHKPPHHGYGPYPASESHGHGAGASLVVTRPHAAGPPPSFEHYPQDWEASGPGLGSEYLASSINRNAIASFKPNLSDSNDINAWGLGLPPGMSMNLGDYAATNNVPQTMIHPNHKPAVGNAGRPVGPPNPYRNRKTKPKESLDPEKEALLRAAALAARAPPSPVRDEILRVSAAKLTENNRVKTESELIRHQQQIIAAEDPETQAAERFYGAILEKVHSVLSTIGASEPVCRERAICSLYRDPFKHTPYSNLISNELSRDSSELLQAADSKMAVQYYKYVQAARDGQENKDCIALYPSCNIDYGKKKK